MRLFCTHTVQKRMRTEASLSLENFNSHWLLTVEQLESVDYHYLLHDSERIIFINCSQATDCFTRCNSSQFEQIDVIIEADEHEWEKDQERDQERNEERDQERDEERNQWAHFTDSETQKFESKILDAWESEQHVAADFYVNFHLN